MIYCCACGQDVEARLTGGGEIYPHRQDLYDLPFWRCDGCGNYVGCHHKSNEPTKPLGCIPSPEVRDARQHLHRLIDPLWKGKPRHVRTKVYKAISRRLGYEYHTAEVRSVEEARHVYRVVKELFKDRGTRPSKRNAESYQPARTQRKDFSDMNKYDMSVMPWDENQVILEQE